MEAVVFYEKLGFVYESHNYSKDTNMMIWKPWNDEVSEMDTSSQEETDEIKSGEFGSDLNSHTPTIPQSTSRDIGFRSIFKKTVRKFRSKVKAFFNKIKLVCK